MWVKNHRLGVWDIVLPPPKRVIHERLDTNLYKIIAFLSCDQTTNICVPWYAINRHGGVQVHRIS